MLDEGLSSRGQTSPVLDVLLCDNQRHTTPIVIEVCHTTGVRNDIKKIIRLIDEYDYGIEEGFLYDYVTHEWQKYRKGKGTVEANNSFSDILKLDLNQFL